MAVVLHFGQVVENIIEKIRSEPEDLFVYSKLIARGIIVNKILLKLVERTHAFVPEFYRFAKIAVDLLI